ncbi:hypothetical protein C9374_002004 [Naegleria lovaniensis]|uniref:Ras family small GTPase n=1 Tax=Naegleria lovaniensis TaxID=51637 RepID=A0AA88GVK7_NAELO|nr:uncharacterized protein C9374_002004 [Naegleria lovaniensis]KAG2386969.1 hypothetical protein C9374_002004 [Naegleria lovaniensis]
MAPKQSLDHVHEKIVVLGSGGVGKSAVILQFIQSVFVEVYDPTLEDSYKKEIIIDSTPVTLEIIDTAGQEELTSLRDNYVKTGDGFLLVYSVTSNQSFEEIVDLIDQILRAKNIDPGSQKDMQSLSAVIIGNKADLQNERAVPYQSLQKLSEKYGNQISIFETSAKNNVNIEDCFMTLAREIFNKKTGRQPVKKDPTGNTGDSKSCCILIEQQQRRNHHQRYPSHYSQTSQTEEINPPASPISLQSTMNGQFSPIFHSNMKHENSSSEERSSLLRSKDKILSSRESKKSLEDLPPEEIERKFMEEEVSHSFQFIVVTSVVICFLAPCLSFVPYCFMCKYKNSPSEIAKAYYNISRAIIVILVFIFTLLVCMIAIPSSIGLSLYINIKRST